MLIPNGAHYQRCLSTRWERDGHQQYQRRRASERAIHGFFRLSAMMRPVSRSLFRPVLLAALLATAVLCGRAAVADSGSLEDAIAGALMPSAAPALLGPITSAGRTGWECKPERSASSAGWHEAELPLAPGTP